jgi:hypothetical protein
MNRAENFQTGEAPNYRALKAVVIILGVLILLAFGVLVGGLIMRAGGGATATDEPYLTAIPLPAGASVTGTELVGNRLMLRIERPGANEVVILDANSGRVMGRVVLQPAN